MTPAAQVSLPSPRKSTFGDFSKTLKYRCQHLQDFKLRHRLLQGLQVRHHLLQATDCYHMLAGSRNQEPLLRLSPSDLPFPSPTVCEFVPCPATPIRPDYFEVILFGVIIVYVLK